MQNVRDGEIRMNTKIKLSAKWKKISVILAGMCGLATLTFNCSPTLFESRKGSGGGGLDIFSIFESTNAPLTLLTAEQTYASMLNVTGQKDSTINQGASVTTISRAEYDLRFGTMSSTHSLGNFNSPLLLATTSLAGDVCNNAITKETAGTRRLFPNVNFNGAPDGNAFLGSAAAMAQAFYGRQISGEEVNALNEYYAEMTTGATQNAALTRAVVLGACAAMLSSFDSLVQ